MQDPAGRRSEAQPALSGPLVHGDTRGSGSGRPIELWRGIARPLVDRMARCPTLAEPIEDPPAGRGTGMQEAVANRPFGVLDHAGAGQWVVGVEIDHADHLQSGCPQRMRGRTVGVRSAPLRTMAI